jgi:SAM-dependent methyltransferase
MSKGPEQAGSGRRGAPVVAATSRGRRLACAVCGHASEHVGTVHGRYSGSDFELRRCPDCGFAFIADPWLDFAAIYDERYYAGRGADPLVDYTFELDHPERTVRRYEWAGIADVVSGLVGGLEGRRWLDFGCGNGGLVRHLRATSACEAVGFEEGAIASAAASHGIPIVSAAELEAMSDSFDVVSAIEVLEHTLDPVGELRSMRALLRPGGLLFVTTGNARAFARHLERWSYVVPEIHISFFEPRTLERAMQAAGFRAEHRALGDGFDSIMKFKVLKNLHVRKRSRLSDALPARALGALARRRAQLHEHPVGWAD